MHVQTYHAVTVPESHENTCLPVQSAVLAVKSQDADEGFWGRQQGADCRSSCVKLPVLPLTTKTMTGPREPNTPELRNILK